MLALPNWEQDQVLACHSVRGLRVLPFFPDIQCYSLLLITGDKNTGNILTRHSL